MYEGRLQLFDRDKLEYRFASPKWRESLVEVPWDRLMSQLGRIDAERCRRLVFAGGGPLAHPRFDDLVDEARGRDLSGFALQTDGASLAPEGLAASLAERGFAEAFILVGGLDEDVHDFATGAAGTVEESRAGIRAAAEAGMAVYLILPLIRSTVAHADELIDWARKTRGAVRGLLLSLPEVAQVPEVSRDVLLSYADTAPHVARIFRRCQINRLEHGFTSKRGLSPCGAPGVLDPYGTVFHDRIAFFKHRPNETLERVDACADCCLQHSCRGVEPAYLDHFGREGYEPVDLDTAMAWKLRPLNRLDQFDYQQISAFENDETDNDMSLVRVNGHCNMACSFCFVDRTVGDSDIEPLIAEIEALRARGMKHLIVSGGEPTLHPRLPEIFERARAMGITSIEMQSNGVKAADPAYAKVLADAGLTMITVSLHSIDPEKSDEITRLPKAFGKTIEAMHNFRKLGVLTQVACVITKMNYRELPEYVRFLRTEFPEPEGHLSICFAIAQGISDLVFPWVIPTFSEIKPYFRDALDYALETEVGFGGMIGQGGYPPCMLDGDMRYYSDVMDRIYRSSDHNKQFYKADRCSECTFDPHCVGVRRSYVEWYGDDEIQPIRAEEPRWRVASER